MRVGGHHHASRPLTGKMKRKIESLLQRLDAIPLNNKLSWFPETAAVIRRSLEGIKTEIEAGTVLDPAVIDELEASIKKLEERIMRSD